MAGKRILIVEDEPLIAMMLEDFLETLGHTVHHCCDSLAEAIETIEGGGFDLAIVDVNLQGEAVWPAATMLREQSIPFMIATGGHVDDPPAEFATTPMLGKPYTIGSVQKALEALTASA